MEFNFTTGDRISFKIVESGLMNPSFKDVEYLATVPFEVAVGMNPELANKHNNLKPYFIVEHPTTVNAKDYQYLIIKHSNGVIDAVGVPWIEKNSLTSLEGKPKIIVISNWSAYMEAPIKDRLTNLGANFVIRDPA